MMNILYCGDANIRDGVLVSVLSLLENQPEKLRVCIATASLTVDGAQHPGVDRTFAERLDVFVRSERPGSKVDLIDASRQFAADPPHANLGTRFTPFCMLRLYADLMPELDGIGRLLYLDNDVLCHDEIAPLYSRKMGDAEIGGVLDRYGRWFFHNELRLCDYLNSGVLLMNMDRIQTTGLFRRARKLCSEKKMFMPDQTALNKLAKGKLILPRRFNEQGRLRKDTALQHFSTRFSATGMVSVKPWQIDQMHEIMKLHDYDHVLEHYRSLRDTLIE